MPKNKINKTDSEQKTSVQTKKTVSKVRSVGSNPNLDKDKVNQELIVLTKSDSDFKKDALSLDVINFTKELENAFGNAKLDKADFQAEKIIELKQKVYEVLKDLPPEDIKVVLPELISNLQKESLKIKDIENVKTKNVVNSSLFDKIYTEEFIQENMSQGFFASSWQIITNQIVLRFITLGIILGVGLFYIQGLQPLLVRNYVVSTNNQIEKVNTRYNDQAKDFFSNQNTVLSKFNYSPEVFCSQIDPYTSSTTDTENLNRLKVSLFPDKTLKTLDSNFQTNLPAIETEYSNFYSYYSKQVINYSDQIIKVQNVIDYWNYLNPWLATCTAVEKSPADLTVLQKQCSSLIESSNKFVAQKPFFLDKIESFNDKGISLCNSLSIGTQKSFIRDFNANFASLASFVPDFKTINLELNNQNTNFSDYKNKSKQNILDIENSKKSGLNQFYILNYKF